jgi:glutamyl-tRNA reductase
MGLVLIGLNHETASLDARERVVYTADDAVSALRTLKESRRVAQAFLLSTCNRTELYALMACSIRVWPRRTGAASTCSIPGATRRRCSTSSACRAASIPWSWGNRRSWAR